VQQKGNNGKGPGTTFVPNRVPASVNLALLSVIKETVEYIETKYTTKSKELSSNHSPDVTTISLVNNF